MPTNAKRIKDTSANYSEYSLPQWKRTLAATLVGMWMAKYTQIIRYHSRTSKNTKPQLETDVSQAAVSVIKRTQKTCQVRNRSAHYEYMEYLM